MKTVIKKMKSELKELAQQIKTQKPQYRATVSAYDKSQVELVGWNKKPYIGKDPKLANDAYKLLSSVESARHEFRHKHIAYCLMRGRTLEQIESSGVRCTTDKHAYGCKCPNMNYVKDIMKGMEDEALRSSEVGSLEVTAGGTSGTCASPVAPAQQEPAGVEERDAGVPEGKGSSLIGRLKGLLG